MTHHTSDRPQSRDPPHVWWVIAPRLHGGQDFHDPPHPNPHVARLTPADGRWAAGCRLFTQTCLADDAFTEFKTKTDTEFNQIGGLKMVLMEQLRVARFVEAIANKMQVTDDDQIALRRWWQRWR